MSSRFRVIRFLQSPVGRIVERAMYRFPPYKRLTSRLVWRELEHDAEFMESLARGKADADAGRLYAWNRDDHKSPHVPSESWQPDDPIQPPGWHHDGSRWVQNDDDGWYADPSGYWRYNAPGDIGWVENPDGSWRYVAGNGLPA